MSGRRDQTGSHRFVHHSWRELLAGMTPLEPWLDDCVRDRGLDRR
jgi:hypothetical protein